MTGNFDYEELQRLVLLVVSEKPGASLSAIFNNSKKNMLRSFWAKEGKDAAASLVSMLENDGILVRSSVATDKGQRGGNRRKCSGYALGAISSNPYVAMFLFASLDVAPGHDTSLSMWGREGQIMYRCEFEGGMSRTLDRNLYTRWILFCRARGGEVCAKARWPVGKECIISIEKNRIQSDSDLEDFYRDVDAGWCLFAKLLEEAQPLNEYSNLECSNLMERWKRIRRGTEICPSSSLTPSTSGDTPDSCHTRPS